MRDILFGLRRLRHEAGSSVVAVLTLGLGIGATTTLFTVADNVLFRPLAWSQPDRLLMIEERRGGARGRTPWALTNGTYNAWRDDMTTLSSIGGWMSNLQTLGGAGDPQRVSVAMVTPSLFSGVLRARPEIGRLLTQEDAATYDPGRALLSHGLWHERFGGDRSVLGRIVELDQRQFEIVGVLPRDSSFPTRDTRLWVPFEPLPLVSGDGRQLRVIVVGTLGRLRDGASVVDAVAEGTARARTVPDIRNAALSLFGAEGEVSVAAAPLFDVLTAEVRPAITLLLLAVLLLLAASTANVVSVQLARATARRHETAIRAALGGGTWRLLSQWLAESALVGVAAGILGVGVAAMVCALLPQWLPADFPRVDDIQLDMRGVVAAMGVTLVVSIICGIVPAVWSRPRRLGDALAEGGIASFGSRARMPATRIRTLIIVGQVAIACVTLVGGSLLARSFIAMVRADRGYDPSNLLTARLAFPHAYPHTRRVQLLEALQGRLDALPGVKNAGFGNGLPLVGHGNTFSGSLPHPTDETRELRASATWRAVSPQYFDALGLRLKKGRALAATDTALSSGVLIVNESFAREYLGPEPLGTVVDLSIGTQPRREVVGVFEDARLGELAAATGPEFLVSYKQAPSAIAWDPMVLLRGEGDVERHVAALRTLVRDLDPTLALDSILTMQDRVVASLARPRAYAAVLGILGALTAIVAGVGLFGVLSYTATQRIPEIGVRMALGARPRSIARLVLRQGLATSAIGLVLGVLLSRAGTRVLSGSLYGIASQDAVSYGIAALVIAIVALAASSAPALRAARVDPIRALRQR